MTPMQPNVLITGASSGIGLACAQRLAANNWQVFAGARRVSDLPTIPNLTPIQLDVSDEHSIITAAATISDRLNSTGLTALVNNAGIAISGPLECITADELRRQFEVNVLGLAAVTRAILPLLRTHSTNPSNSAPTRIINISSVSGLVAYPFLGAYAASKFAVEAMSDALRIELAPWRIGVTLIEPGPIVTPIWQKAVALSAEQASNWNPTAKSLYPVYFEKITARLADSENRGAPVEQVAALVERALTTRRPKSRYPIGPGSTLARIRKYLPDRFWDWLVRRALK